MGQSEFIKKWLFPPKTFYISETIAFFGCMMYMFLIGIKIDLSMVIRSGKKAWAIGIFSFFAPLIMSVSMALLLRKLIINPDEVLYESIFSLVFILSTASFHVTAIHLADLKLLNSEMGRIGLSASMVSGTISLLWITSAVTQRQASSRKDSSINSMTICLLAMIAFTICVLRPIMFWMIRQTPEGKPIKESYILSVFLMLLGCALFSEVIGEHFMLGPVIFGMAVPDGPPLGSALTERLETMVSTMFLPLYFLYSGASFKFYLIDARTFAIVQVVAVVAFLGKVGGTMLPSMYWKMPVNDVLLLGLLMSAQGITQVLYLQTSFNLYVRFNIPFF